MENLHRSKALIIAVCIVMINRGKKIERESPRRRIPFYFWITHSAEHPLGELRMSRGSARQRYGQSARRVPDHDCVSRNPRTQTKKSLTCASSCDVWTCQKLLKIWLVPKETSHLGPKGCETLKISCFHRLGHLENITSVAGVLRRTLWNSPQFIRDIIYLKK